MRTSAFLFIAVSRAAILDGVLQNVDNIRKAAFDVIDSKTFSKYLDSTSNICTLNTPEATVNRIQQAMDLSNHNPVSLAGLLKLLGLIDILSPSAEQLSGCRTPFTWNNSGNPDISNSVYAQAPGDAPWDISEEKLRAVMYLPPGFTHGRKMPVLMVPGTGIMEFDPVYLNVENYLMDDIQDTAEHIAYVLKYLHAMTNSSIATLTWSQGGISVAWSLQFWPSLRNLTTDVINLSANYKGTQSTYLTCPLALCGDSLWQQRPNSQFLKTLNAGGGGSAWIPTTSIMSLTDDVILQTGDKNSAGYINDERNVGATNTFVQKACAGKLGGIPYTHEGIMFSNLAYELAVDALLHEGPGQVSRLDLDDACNTVATKGLSSRDIIDTIGTILVAGFNIGTQPPTTGEPPIKPYAQTLAAH